MAEVDRLTIELDSTSDEATKSIDKLVAILDDLGKVSEESGQSLNGLKINFDKMGNLKSVNAALKNVQDTVKKSKPDYSSLTPEIKDIAKQFATLPPEAVKAAQAASKASDSLKALSGTKVAPTLDEATASLEDLRQALDKATAKTGGTTADIKKMADAYASLPPSVQKAIQANAKLDAANDTTAKSFKTAEKAGISFGDVLKANVISDAIIGGVRALGNAIASVGRELVDFAKSGIETASNLEEVQNVVDTTFGAASGEIDTFAKGAANAFGLSELSAKQFSGTMGAMLSSMDLDDSKVLEMSTALTGLAGDMASFYNLDAEEAFNKLRSGISGETEPLKQLGINMSVANLEAFALAQGIDKAFDSMTQAEQATLRYNYIMQATADAQGDFAKTSGSYANQQRILQLNLENLGASIGQKLLPTLTELTSAFNQLLSGEMSFEDFVGQLTPIISGIAEGIITNLPTIASAAGQIFSTIGTVITENIPTILSVGGQILQTIATGILENLPSIINTGADILLNVAQGVIEFLPELAPAGVQIITELVAAIAQALPVLIPAAVDAVMAFTEGLIDNIDTLIDAGIELMGGLIDGIVKAIPQLLDKAPEIITKVVTALADNYPKILEAGILLLGELTMGIIKAIPDLVKALPQIITAIVEGIGDLMGSILEVGKNIVQGIWEGIKSAASWLKEKVTGFFSGIVDGVKDFLGINSPSTLFAGIGTNMAEGLGVGWDKSITGISAGLDKSIKGIAAQASIPLSMNLKSPILQPQAIQAAYNTPSFTTPIYNTTHISNYATPEAGQTAQGGGNDYSRDGEIVSLLQAIHEGIEALREKELSLGDPNASFGRFAQRSLERYAAVNGR